MGNLIEGNEKSNQKNTCTYSSNTTSCTHPKVKKKWLIGKSCTELTDHCKCPYYQGKPKGTPPPAPQSK